MAAELIVAAKTLNPPKFRYGQFRVWGHLRASRYFQIAGQPNADALIRSLSCKALGTPLGRSFQGHAAIRQLTGTDHRILTAFAKRFSLDPRARILPEEELEAAILTGDAEAVRQLVAREEAGIAEARRRYLFESAVKRNRQLVVELREMYGGICQITGWNPRQIYGVDLCETHHIHWLSRGGEDQISNLLLVCPNVHHAIHACDAQLDWSTGQFVFPEISQAIALNRHLEIPAR